MIAMEYTILPVGAAPFQTITLPASPNNHPFLSRLSLRYLPAPGRWFLTISDAVSGAVYANHIPLVCSYGEINDLLAPFAYLFQGSGLGSLFVLKAVEAPSSSDPGENNLSEFYIIWGDTWKNS